MRAERTGTGYNKMDNMGKIFLFPFHILSNIKITKYFNYEPRFIDVFTRDNLPRIKDGAYVINLDGEQSKRKHWASLFIDRNTIAYFDSFIIEYIAQEVLNKKINQSLTTYLEYHLMILLWLHFIVLLSHDV